MASSFRNSASVQSRHAQSRPAIIPAIPLPYVHQHHQRQSSRQQNSPSASLELGQPAHTPKTSMVDVPEPEYQAGKPVQLQAHKGPAGYEPDSVMETHENGSHPSSQSHQRQHSSQRRPETTSPSGAFSRLSLSNTPAPEVAVDPPFAPQEFDNTVVSLPLSQPMAPRGNQQVKPGNNRLVFGAVYDSNTPSPAPHSGGSFVPPPPAAPAGPPQWQGYASGPEAGPDHFPHPSHQHPLGSSNGYHAIPAPPFGPSSPHSIPSSDNGRQQSPLTNGFAPPGLAAAPSPGAMPPFDPRPAFPDMAVLHQLVGTVSRGWNNPDLADCFVDFHILKPQDGHSGDSAAQGTERLQLHGHRLLFSQSPRLQQLFLAEPGEDRRLSRFNHWLVDKFLTLEALAIALQSLYGIPPPPLPAIKGDLNAQTYVMQKSLALAAAGQNLELPYIRDLAIQEARHFLNWGNLELVLDFCLTNAEHLYPSSSSSSGRHGGYAQQEPCAEAHFTYGPLARLLLTDVAMFVSEHLYSDFVLDPTVSDPIYARIPPLAKPSPNRHLEQTAAAPAEQSTPPSPVILHGASRSVSNVPRHSVVRSIQFGDLSPPSAPNNESQGNAAGANTNGHSNEGASYRHADSNDQNSILSRVLLNLPFDFLRLVLESRDLGAVSGVSIQMPDRGRIMGEVTSAREQRRLGALEAAQTGRVDQEGAVAERLKRREPLGGRDLWEGLCWREDVLAGNNEVPPFMVRQWVPLQSP